VRQRVCYADINNQRTIQDVWLRCLATKGVENLPCIDGWTIACVCPWNSRWLQCFYLGPGLDGKKFASKVL
jgi:hypothetical protein